MQYSNAHPNLLSSKKCLLIPGWFKFLCSLALVFYSLSYLMVSSFWFSNTLPDTNTSNLAKTPTYFFIMSLFFVPFILSVYGLLKGRNWGLYGCLILSYLAAAEHLYQLVITGTFGLGLIIVLVMLVQLHKIKVAWATLDATYLSESKT